MNSNHDRKRNRVRGIIGYTLPADPKDEDVRHMAVFYSQTFPATDYSRSILLTYNATRSTISPTRKRKHGNFSPTDFTGHIRDYGSVTKEYSGAKVTLAIYILRRWGPQ